MSFLTYSLLMITILAFIDYEIAFDSMQTQAAMTWVRRYVHRTPDNSNDSPPTKESNKTNITRGIRQGNSISPKLTIFKTIFRRLSWKTRGFRIDGEYLNHLRLADDIHMYTNTQTNDAGASWSIEYQGVTINKSKTKGGDGKPNINTSKTKNVES